MAAESIKEGKIIAKSFIAAYKDTGVNYEYNFFTRKFEFVTYEIEVPDCWYLQIKKMVQETPVKYKKKNVKVSKTEYNRYDIGDWYKIE